MVYCQGSESVRAKAFWCGYAGRPTGATPETGAPSMLEKEIVMKPVVPAKFKLSGHEPFLIPTGSIRLR